MLQHTGSVNVNSGIAESGRRQFRQHHGDFNLASGATLRLAGNFSLAASADVAGAGTVIFESGTNTVAGTYNITGRAVLAGEL